jgi:cullin-4
VVLIVTDLPRDGEMVERLLNFKAFAEKAANTAFVDYTPLLTDGASTSKNVPQKYKATSNVDYDYAIRDGFQAGFSKRRNKPAEMIAKYLDRAMRKGQKNATDIEFMTLLERVLQLYRFTDDKDVFRTYYMRALAKRLLLSRSANDAFEIAVLKKLTDGMDAIILSNRSAELSVLQNTTRSSQREKLCLRIWHSPVTW